MLSAAGRGETTPADTAAKPPEEPVTVMEKFVVSDVPTERQVLPTVRPIGSVMGDDRNIIDTPRAVSSINKAWMEERQIHDSTDFSQFSPGVSSPPSFGIAASPVIRGDSGSIYFNGQTGLFSGNNVFPSFNGVESMDIVKGPGSAVYGPQNNGIGGYVNLVNKKPYFDGPHLDLGLTLGYWTSGHSYANPEFKLDYSAPLNAKTAYRMSYLSRYGQGYAQNQKTAWSGENDNLIRWGHLESFSPHKTFAFMVSLKTARALKARLQSGETIKLHAQVTAGQHAASYEVVTATIDGADPKLKDNQPDYRCAGH